MDRESLDRIRRGFPPNVPRKKGQKKYSIEEVLKHVPLVRSAPYTRFYVDFDGDIIDLSARRYRLFANKGVQCVDCGIEGRYFIKARHCNATRWHFALIAFNAAGEEVLMTMDHIVELGSGGARGVSNAQPMCYVCNQKKNDLYNQVKGKKEMPKTKLPIEAPTGKRLPLHRKHRPLRFDDVAQPVMGKVLKAQVAGNTHVSTYMVHGPSGTGKTTLSRIMAMALQCENPASGEPCGVCTNCDLIRRDVHPDVVELNCSDHTGVDDIRGIIDQMRLMPSRGEWRIFILDESHSLSKQAQNALLKPAEEPPPYVKFFLCTTEPQNILGTIKGRCQKIGLVKVSDKDIRALLEKVVKIEGIEADTAALDLIAKSSQGNAREALVTLEQVMGIGVTESNVRDLIRRSPRERALSLIHAVQTGGRGEAYQILDAAGAEGCAIDSLLEDCVAELMLMVRYLMLKTAMQERDPLLSLLMQEFRDKGNHILMVANGFIETLKTLRHNVMLDQAIMAQVGILNTIGNYAPLRAALLEAEQNSV